MHSPSIVVLPFANPSKVANLAVILFTWIVSRMMLLTLVPNISVLSNFANIVLLRVTSILSESPNDPEPPPEEPEEELDPLPVERDKIFDTSVLSDFDFV